jgi:hypothetical protein
MQRATVEKLALDHAWDWFEYHATQRMTMIRFYLIAIGGIGAGIGALLSAHENLLASTLSIVGFATSYCFKQLDKRVADLVKIGENALKPEQLKMSTALGSSAFEICRMADEGSSGKCLYTYGQNFRFLFGMVMMVFALAAIFGGVRAVCLNMHGLPFWLSHW